MTREPKAPGVPVEESPRLEIGTTRGPSQVFKLTGGDPNPALQSFVEAGPMLTLGQAPEPRMDLERVRKLERDQLEHEFEAMRAIAYHFGKLDPKARDRVLAWLASRFGG